MEHKKRKKSKHRRKIEEQKHYDTFYSSAPPKRLKEKEHLEDAIPDVPENQGAREFLANAPTKGLWMPLGKEVKVMQCWRCKRFGHRTGDRECPMFMSGNKLSERFRWSHEDPMHNYFKESEKREKEERIMQLQALLESSSSSDSSSSHSSSTSSSGSSDSDETDKRWKKHHSDSKKRKKHKHDEKMDKSSKRKVQKKDTLSHGEGSDRGRHGKNDRRLKQSSMTKHSSDNLGEKYKYKHDKRNGKKAEKKSRKDILNKKKGKQKQKRSHKHHKHKHKK